MIRRVVPVVLALLLAASGPGDSPVADAAMAGDTEQVRALIKQGADVNAAQGDGMTALHWAAENGDDETTNVLVFAGARLEAATRNGAYTPLHLASEAGHAAVIAALLAAGADANARTGTGVTPLHFAARSGDVAAVRALIAGKAALDAQESAAGQTPLIWAAATNRAEAIEALLAAGADASVTTQVVDVVARVKEDKKLKEQRDRIMALRWGREPTNARPNDTVVTKDTTAAAKAKEQEKEKEKVPSFDFSDLMGRKGGLTALHHAAREGHLEAVNALLAGGADVNALSTDKSTPLLVATINGHFDTAMRLLERGADPKLATEAGATPLYTTINLQWAPTAWYPQPTAHRQQSVTYLEMMKALLAAGADPNARLESELWYSALSGAGGEISHWGATPFWRAAYGTDVDAMKLLIEHGADPAVATRKKPGGRGEGGGGGGGGQSQGPLPAVPTGGPAIHPIHAVTGAGYGQGLIGNGHRHVPGGWMPSLRYLVEELGADVNVRDQDGYTPLHNAASRGDNEMILYLVAKGADVTAESRKGETTADLANGPTQRVSPFPATIELLERLGAKNNHRCVSC
jgi:ankyrin repeat protein